MGWLDGGTSPSGSTTTTNTTTLPPYISNQQSNLINESNLLASRRYPLYPASRIAGFTAPQTAAANWIEQGVDQGIPNIASQGGYSQGVANQVAGYQPWMVQAAQLAPLQPGPSGWQAPQGQSPVGGAFPQMGQGPAIGASQPFGRQPMDWQGQGNTPQLAPASSTGMQPMDWQGSSMLGGALPAPAAGQSGDPISQLYQSVLGRAPDPAGLQAWQNAAAGGMSTDAIRQAFLASPEYQADVSAGRVDPGTGNFLTPPANYRSAPSTLPGIGGGIGGQPQGQYPGLGGQFPAMLGQGAQPGLAGVPSVTPQTLAGTDLGSYLNPFANSVIDATNANLARQNDILNSRAGSTAESQGAYGGSRDALVQAENNRNLQQTMGLTDAQLGAANFTQAQNAAAGDITRNQAAQTSNQGVAANQASLNAQLSQQANLANQQANQNGQLLRLQGAGQGANLANSSLQNQLSGAQALWNLGGQQQNLNQQNQSLAYQDFMNQFNYPTTQLQQQLGVLGGLGNYGTTQTQTQPYFTNPTANTLSTLLGAGQLAGMAGNAYNWLNANVF